MAAVGCRVAATALLVMLVAATAASGDVTSDQSVAKSLVVSRSDARPLFPRYMSALPAKYMPCQTVGADIVVTATARGNWGGIQQGLWSTATVAETRPGAARLYRHLLDAVPACLVREAERLTPSYKSPLCNRSARVSRLWEGRYGDRSSAWRASFYSRYRNGCTFHALDGMIVRTGRAVAYYLFANVEPAHRAAASLKTAQDEAIIRRAVSRAAITS